MKSVPLYCVLIFILNCTGIVYTQEEKFAEEWRWVQFTTASGLPSNNILTVLETSDGTIWVCTSNGIAYFDGYQWIPIDESKGIPHGLPALINESYNNRIFVIIDGRAYEGNKNGFQLLPLENVNNIIVFEKNKLLIIQDVTLSIYENGMVTPFALPVDAGGRLVLNLFRTKSGKIWLNVLNGLYCLENGQWIQKLSVQKIRLSVNSIIEDKYGNGFASIAAPVEIRGLWEWKNNGTFIRNTTEYGEYIHSGYIAPNGDVLAYHESNELRLRKHDKWIALPPLPQHIQNIQYICYRNNGDAWIGTNNGLYLFRQSSSRWSSKKYTTPDSRNRINEILKTSRDEIWFGTGSGVEILSPGGEKTSTTHIGKIPLNEITALGEDNEGGIWLGSGNSFKGTFRWYNNQWEHFPILNNDDGVYIHKIRKDHKGRLWFLGLSPSPFTSKEQQPGAYVFESGKFTRWSTAEGLIHGRVYSFVEGKDGAFWFATIGGISKWKNGKWKHWTSDQGLISNRIFTVVIDSSNQLWFADQFNGIGTINAHDEIHYYSTSDGLISAKVWELCVASNGTLWYASSGGLGCFANNQWSTFGGSTGLHNSRLWSLLPIKDKILAGTLGAGLAILNLK